MPSSPDPLLTLLVMRAQDGDLTALDTLIARFQPRLLAYLRVLAEDDTLAMDLLQDTLLSAVQSLRRLRSPDAVTAWFFQLARNRTADHFRKTRRDWLAFEDIEEPAASLAAEPIDLEPMRAALVDLPPPLQEVVRLHYFEELSIADVAAIVAIKPGTVKSRLHTARQRLAEAMARSESAFHQPVARGSASKAAPSTPPHSSRERSHD